MPAIAAMKPEPPDQYRARTDLRYSAPLEGLKSGKLAAV
jgi:hypothetical protein